MALSRKAGTRVRKATSLTDLRSLSSWGNKARETFLITWGFVPLISILNYLDLIKTSSGTGLIISIIVAIVWTVSGMTWAVAGWRRRR